MQVRGSISILMAEDDVDDQVLISDAFLESGVDIAPQFVDDGVELMRHLGAILEDRNRRLPDLVLLDLNMPRMDGREALRAIREHAGLRHLPVIVLTTSRSERDILISYQLGANSYVTKPSRYEDLIAVLHSLERFWAGTAQLPSVRPEAIE